METMSATRSSKAVAVKPDSSWRELYRVGGISAILATLIYMIATVVDFSVQPAPTSGGVATLEYIAEHRSVYILEQVLWLSPSVLLTVVFLALYVALKDLNKSYAAIGGVLGIVSWALTLVYPATGGGAPALVYLSDHYAAATGEAQRVALVAAAETFIAQNTIPTAVGILEPVGISIFALIMLKGIFHRSVAYLGLATGALGIVSEALRPVLGLGYIVYGLLLFVWFIAIGWELYRLGAGRKQRHPTYGSNPR